MRRTVQQQSEDERLQENKTELLRCLLEESTRRLEAASILLAVSEAGDLRIIVTEGDAHQAHQAVMDGFTLYSPKDAHMYVSLSEHERKLLHQFKKRFGGTVDWNGNQ